MSVAHREKIIEAAKEILKFHGYFIGILWHTDDVHFICEQNDLPAISNSEAMKVFDIAAQLYDGEVGLSWPQLENALRHYLNERVKNPAALPQNTSLSVEESA